MQAPVDRYMKDGDSRRSEDATEIARVERQVMIEVEFERSEDARENLRLEKQIVTEDVTGKVQDNCNGPWNEKISFLNT